MARAWTLKNRPEGIPADRDFALEAIDLAPPGEGQVHVRNRWLSVDPYMRGRMNDAKSYVPPFALGAPMDGGAVGEVVESNDPRFAPGDLVLHMAGWRDEAVIAASALTKLPEVGAAPQQFLGILGTTGATAYFGLLDAAAASESDIVFVSAAAGAVGSAVVQIAKAKGMKVIGSAGGPAKCEFVQSLGADQVIDYRSGALVKKLAAAAKALGDGGIDVYFDNVGGNHLDAALALARNHARFAICGMIAGYNDPKPASLRFLMRVIAARIAIKGFLVFDYQPRMEEFQRDMAGWLASGAVRSHETVVDGLEAMPEAFRGLFSGANTGKMLVRL